MPISSSLLSRISRWALLIIVLLVLAVAGYKGARLWPHASALLGRAAALQARASGEFSATNPADLAWLREQLGATREDLQAIQAEIRFLLPLMEHLGWVPRIGHDLAAAPALLEAGIHLCDAGWWGLLGLEPVADSLSQPEQPDQSAIERALPALAVSRPRFAEAEAALASARRAWRRLDGRALSPRLAAGKALGDRYLPLLEGGVKLAQIAPGLLGYERPVTYLILAQNNHELRPTGGFISGAGVIQLAGGKIITMTFQDSYAVDALCPPAAHPPAPAPLREYIWAPALMFRDANWSPHFPTSAAVATSIYRRCLGLQVDGVIAFDLDAVVSLLRGLGPLQPEGYPEAVTADTFLRYVAQYWTNPLRTPDTAEQETGEWWRRRKDFMADLLQAALQRITSAPQTIPMGKFAPEMLRALQGKHLLLHLRDPAAAQVLADMSWDGALRSWDGDYWLVVDANLGFRKVNPNIQQSIEYQVDGSAGVPRATLIIHYLNQSAGTAECIAGSRYDNTYEEMMQGCYWDYVRVYVPRGSRLLGVVGSDRAPETGEEEGKAVFSAFLVLAPGASRDLIFHYELPFSPPSAGEGLGVRATSPRPSTGEGLGVRVYPLLIQKQPGTPNIPVQVSVSGLSLLFDPLHSDVAAIDEAGRVRFELTGDTRLTWIEPESGRAHGTWLPAISGFLGVLLILLGLAVWTRQVRA
ncbi:MAG: DUF4012 domain-containing protein [Chloroflexi bacterium]|nr:DUF4012 domain-containing protein [Chloroflexota bacterium]